MFIPPLRNAENAGADFWQKLVQICARHGWDPRAIAAVMAVETGYTFAADAGRQYWTPKRTATGLIQFIEATARALGVRSTKSAPDSELAERGEGKAWSTWTLMKMNALEQLDLVEKYYERAFRVVAPTRPVDYYLATWGSSPGQPLSDVLAREGTKIYEANKGLDRDGDGAIKVDDLNEVVMGAYPRQWVPTDTTLPKPDPTPTGSLPSSEVGPTFFLQVWRSWGSGSSHLGASRAEHSLLPTLEYGSRGPAVALLQTLLNLTSRSASGSASLPKQTSRSAKTSRSASGTSRSAVASASMPECLGKDAELLCSPLGVDGGFGMKTRAAVKNKQLELGIADDRIVGPVTWTAIIIEVQEELAKT
jgi:hypothetical protein